MKQFSFNRFLLFILPFLVFSSESFSQVYRTKKAGDFTDASIWEYGSGTSFSAAASAPKTSASIEVRHALVLNYNLYVAAGKTFTIYAPGTLTINPVNSITIAGSANFNDQPVTFKSDATGTGRFGTLTGTIKGATNIRAERYIPLGKRSYRHLAPGVNPSGDICSNWQNGGIYAPGIGTHITGAKGTSGTMDEVSGFDMTASGAASMFTFTTGASYFSPVTSTHTPLRGLQGYRIFIRGDRYASLTAANNSGAGTPNINMNNATTLVTKGSLITGTVTYTTSGASANGIYDPSVKLATAQGSFSLLANPYMSPVNFNNLTMLDVVPTFWVWLPNIGNRGAYVSYTHLGDGSGISNGAAEISEFIQPGQAIFVQSGVELTSTTYNGNPFIRFKENNKSTQATNAFRQQTQTPARVIIGLITNKNLTAGGPVQDAATVAFREGFKAAIDHEDAIKFTNPDENIAVVRNGTLLGLEGRPEVAGQDTINIRLSQLFTANSYSLKVEAKEFATGITAFVEDRLTSKQYTMDIKGTTVIPFNFTTADSSTYANRFRIILTRQKTVQLNQITKKQARPLGDDSSLITLSKAVTIYPNPIKGNKVNMQFSGIQNGKYSVMLYNKGGQQVYNTLLNLTSGKSAVALSLPHSIPSGLYTLVVMDKKDQISNKSVLIDNN